MFVLLAAASADRGGGAAAVVGGLCDVRRAAGRCGRDSCRRRAHCRGRWPRFRFAQRRPPAASGRFRRTTFASILALSGVEPGTAQVTGSESVTVTTESSVALRLAAQATADRRQACVRRPLKPRPMAIGSPKLASDQQTGGDAAVRREIAGCIAARRARSRAHGQRPHRRRANHHLGQGARSRVRLAKRSASNWPTRSSACWPASLGPQAGRSDRWQQHELGQSDVAIKSIHRTRAGSPAAARAPPRRGLHRPVARPRNG